MTEIDGRVWIYCKTRYFKCAYIGIITCSLFILKKKLWENNHIFLHICNDRLKEI